jgi:transcriptional regulator with XRE-family HTH domain
MSAKREPTTDAVEILYRRYIQDNPERLASLEEEGFKLDIAQQVYDLREEAGLTQKQLAKRVGVSESVIRDLEDTEYEGDAFLMLRRIAKVLGKQVEVRVAPLKVEQSYNNNHDESYGGGDYMNEKLSLEEMKMAIINLPVESQWQFLEDLLKSLRVRSYSPQSSDSWDSLYGIAKGIWEAEDAQEYVNRLRGEREI